MTAQPQISGWQAWLLAARPKTLPAAVAPVLVGTAVALHDNAFRALPALAAMLGALLLQIGVNIANDYFDYVRGVDQPDRTGPTRVTQSGLIAPARVRLGMVVVFGLAVLVGVYLVIAAGWPVLVIGIASILAALAYSAGPFPLASHGLGDLFVFIFFGLVAVVGTYYVQAQQVTTLAVLAAIPPGLLITAILVVNNLRDIATDRRAGKHTLAVLLGERGTQVEFGVLLALAYLTPLVLWLGGWLGAWALIPWLTLPLAVILVREIVTLQGRALNQTLSGTARLALIFSILFAVGILV
ncbi:MAG TPA: 1,4-dihydroxy-2-naphthoate polyprenyltransferase [Aggregatilineales bacterium]|nr:1,4-dihydroxy-2-naphthoate polyprenyltransferase [Aggregatilineales bacterium]HPV05431.1 1,4-dihydroxy-2-naphthoate polyprenyltransferase [Aggregatilineales bacterium]HQA68385.1 1,4-dihydroxy-2-naphthoate polyprenyltransferase [Aggregatilineales bacterium]HQE19372.1 1,4-dihydroxy-2-naphthoate polyprenyltransferase [Aggregatilineales bacterium]